MADRPALREKMFCRHYLDTGCAREAAVRAGLPGDPSQASARALRKKEVRRFLRELEEESQGRSLKNAAIRGLERLAFGPVTDAVRLLDMEGRDLWREAEKLDLYCLSEIRQIKGGGLELKFGDRLKALETLYRLSCDAGEGGDNLLKALELSAAALPREEDSHEA